MNRILLLCSIMAIIGKQAVTASGADCQTISMLGTLKSKCFPFGFTEEAAPKSFSLSTMDLNTNALVLQGRGRAASEHDPAIPVAERLSVVQVRNFNEGSDHPRFPLNQLFNNIKQHVKSLELHSVKLGLVTEEDFRGFALLENLLLNDAKLTSISLATFDDLGAGYSGSAMQEYRPSLKTIVITMNKDLMEIDWSVFAPVSNSLLEISLTHNGLESVICSSPFELQLATMFSFRFNDLHQLPPSVYQTFNTELALSIDLAGNHWCQDSANCTCCEMAGLARWMRIHNQTEAIRGLVCGQTGALDSTTFASNTFPNCQAKHRGILNIRYPMTRPRNN